MIFLPYVESIYFARYALAVHEPTLKQLRAFSAVVDEGSIAAAARALHLTAPAVGQQVRQLERGVGVPLSVRTNAGLVPTDAGKELLATTARVEAELDSCRKAVELIRLGKSGSVSLGAISTSKYFIPQALAAFSQIHPDIDVKMHTGNRAETLSAIANFAVDIAITGRPPAELEVDAIQIGPNPHVVIASPNHPLAGRKHIGLSEVCKETFLAREPNSGTRILTNWLFTTAGAPPNIGMEMLSNETIKQSVMADLGVALLSAHTVAAELADGRLIALPVEQTPVIRKWHAVRRKQGHLSPAGLELWNFLTQDAVKHLPVLDLETQRASSGPLLGTPQRADPTITSCDRAVEVDLTGRP